ncbi:uncharacterized protein A4U43_C02F12250 [Asparagus officinalis]|uniref:Uncharacterized protein n=1 Tax=Asparagus officinalis TaxID=4686 RepID=A0A5P1FHX5_ASPOF|nr:uncharacterized protein A4U43_C02F12250 [Asparagus officinalis]
MALTVGESANLKCSLDYPQKMRASLAWISSSSAAGVSLRRQIVRVGSEAVALLRVSGLEKIQLIGHAVRLGNLGLGMVRVSYGGGERFEFAPSGLGTRAVIGFLMAGPTEGGREGGAWVPAMEVGVGGGRLFADVAEADARRAGAWRRAAAGGGGGRRPGGRTLWGVATRVGGRRARVVIGHLGLRGAGRSTAY